MASIISAGTTDSTSLNVSGDKSGILQLASNNAVTAVTIDASQRVGIGATPSAQLQVFCQDSVSGKAIRAAYDGTYYSDYTENAINWYNNNYNINVKSGSNLIFKTADTERMRIDSAGSVAIGSTSTASATRLTLKGAGTGTNTLLNCQDSGGTALLTLAENGKLIMATSTYGLAGQFQAGITASTSGMNSCVSVAGDQNGPYPIGSRGNSTTQGLIGFFDGSNSTIGSITKSGSSVAYNTSSDYRLKENIVPMTRALNIVAQLKPVTYKWKADGSKGQGFIAHELQAVVPDCVTGEKDAVETYKDENGNEQTRPKYQGVDTSFLVATLTAAIQELKAINDTQAETINALTARIVALEGA